MIDYQQEQGRLDPPGIPDDIAFLNGTLEKMLNELRLASAPAPSNIPLNPGVILQTTVRYRGIVLVFSGGTASEVMALKVGAASVFQFIIPAQPTIVPIPLPLILPSGQDVQLTDLTTPAATNWRATLFAVVQPDREKA